MQGDGYLGKGGYSDMVKKLALSVLSFLLLYPYSAFGATWYVRTSSGEYGAENGTSYATAFDGFSGISWASVSPGDTIYVCGTFTGETNQTGKSGTSGNPITFDGSCPGSSSGDLNANSSGQRGFRSYHNYITVKNLTVRNFGSQYGVQAGSTGGAVSNNTFDNINVYGGTATGIVFVGNTIKLLNSNVHDISGTGVLIIGPSGTTSSNIQIAYNTFNALGQSGGNFDGISCSNGSGNVTVNNNVVTNVVGTSGSSCIDQSSGAGYPAETAYIYNNYVNNCNYGIGAGDEVVQDTLHIHNNIIGNATYGLALRAVGTYYVYNNTFVGSGSVGFWIPVSGSKTVYSKNNIFSGTYSDLFSYTSSGLTMTSDYNNYCKLPSCSNDGFPGQESNSLNTNPLFVSSSDFHLQSGSPMISAGTSVGLSLDYDGVSIPQGGGYDIGAYEFVTGGVDTTPNAFSFTDVTNASLSTQYVSNSISVTGIDSSTSISISGSDGEYSVNGGGYTSLAGTVSLNDTVTVRQTSSGSYSTAVNTTLNVGGVTDVYTVTTIANVTPPVISDSNPSELSPGITQTTISVTTDVASTCRYSTSTGVAYDDMVNTFVGGGTTSHSTIVGGNTYSDNFNRANENPLSTSNWTVSGSGTNSLRIVSNAVLGNYSVARNSSYYSAGVMAANQYSQVAASDNSIGPAVRIQSGQAYMTGYTFREGYIDEAGTLAIRRYNTNGSSTQISSVAGTISPGDVLRLEMDGNVLTPYINGVEVPGLSVTDDTYIQGYPGIYTWVNDISADDWSAGGLYPFNDGESYSYYVRCSDASGNKNTSDYTISFSIPGTIPNRVPKAPYGIKISHGSLR